AQSTLVSCASFPPETDGVVAILFCATSQRLRLDSKCGVLPRTEMLWSCYRSDPTGSCHEADERHGWRHSQPVRDSTSSINQPNPSRRDPSIRRCEQGEVDCNFCLPARPDRNSTMNSDVANPGCERTAGKITGVSNLVNRTLAIFFQISDYF